MGGSQALATPRNVLPGTVPLSYRGLNFSQITVTVDLIYFGQFQESVPPFCDCRNHTHCSFVFGKVKAKTKSQYYIQ